MPGANKTIYAHVLETGEAAELPHNAVMLTTRELDTYCCGFSQVHRHNYYEVHWLARGTAILFCDFERHRLAAGTLTFIAPGQVHVWQPLDPEAEILSLSFRAELFTSQGQAVLPTLLQRFYTDPFVPAYLRMAEDEQAALFDFIFRTAHQRQMRYPEQRERLLLAYLNLILAEAGCIAPSADAARTEINAATRLARQFLVSVEQHYRGRKQVRDYAELLGVTPNHLVETVRRTLGKTPGQLLSARLLLEAKRLLVYTPQTVAEIGYALNFTSPAQFGRWFQNLEGCPPGHFRQTFVAQQV